MEVVLIGDKQIKLEILRIIVFLYTVVPKGIAVFLLMGVPSATLAWYKQPPAMRVCIKSYTKKSPIVLQ